MTPPAQRVPNMSPARLALLKSLLRALQALSPQLASIVAFRMMLRPARRKLQPADAQFMATARPHRLMAGTDPLQAYEWGSGPRTVLLAHGWNSRASRLVLLADALVKRGWRVLAFDAPGHGLSPGHSSSLPQFMAALDAVAVKLGPVQAVVGHSVGALAVACRRTNSLAAWFDSLQKVVLVSMPAGLPFLVESFKHLFGIGPAAAHHLHARFERRFGVGPEDFIADPQAAPLKLPTLLIHDRSDDVVPFAHSELLLSALTCSRLLVTDTVGHGAVTRDAATIQTVCEFLDDVNQDLFTLRELTP